MASSFEVVIDEHWCCVGNPRLHDPVHPSDLRLSVYDSDNNRRLALIANSVAIYLASCRVAVLHATSCITLANLRAEWQRTGVVVTGVSACDFASMVLQPGGMCLRHGAYVYIIDRGTFCLSLSWLLALSSVDVAAVLERVE